MIKLFNIIFFILGLQLDKRVEGLYLTYSGMEGYWSFSRPFYMEYKLR